MTWEETIEYIRTKPEYKFLVEKAYFEADLVLNVERFRISEEFLETLKLFKTHLSDGKTLLDIGCGNGISAIAFALEGYFVHAVEPDPSDTIGAGAVRWLKAHYKLSNIEVYECFAEEINFETSSFDIVYARQCMHHAYDLPKFVQEAGRVLRTQGIFVTIRDHVIFNEDDKKWFLECHPLHKYYHGENAFTATEYKNAITSAGLTIEKELKFYDSAINYFPLEKNEIENYTERKIAKLKKDLKSKIGILVNLPFVMTLNKWKNKAVLTLDESTVPGRMYSYIAKKV